jgi:hypothetical protein
MAFERPGGQYHPFIADMAAYRPVIPPEAQTHDIDETLDEREVTRAALKHTLGEHATQDYVVPPTSETDNAKESIRPRFRIREVQLPPFDEEQQ